MRWVRGLLQVLFIAAAVEMLVRAFLKWGPIYLVPFGNAERPYVAWVPFQRQIPKLDDWFVHDAAKGWDLRPGTWTLAGDTPCEASDAHVRLAPGVPEEPPGAATVVLVGDSFKFGMYVPGHEAWGGRLDTALDGVRVINRGVPGYGLDQIVLTARDEILPLRPSLVLLGLVSTDVDRAAYDLYFHRKPRAEVGDDGLARFLGQPVPPMAQVLADERWRIKAFDVVRVVHQRVRRDAYLDHRALGLALLRTFAAEARAAGVPAAVVGLPSTTRPEDDVYLTQLLPEAEAMGLPVFDLRPAFTAAGEVGSDLSKGQDHWTARGHVVAAEALAPWVAGLLAQPSP